MESQILLCKTLIFTWKLEFYPWQQILAVVFLDRTKSSSFSRKRLANTQVQIIIVSLSVILSVKVKKTASLAYTSVFQQFICILPILSHWIVKQHVLKGQNLNKINHFYSFIKDIPKWKRFLVLFTAMAVKVIVTTGRIWCHCLDKGQRICSFTHHCAPSVPVQYSESSLTPQEFYKSSFDLTDFLVGA